jgi:hypothetical protein
LISWSTKTIGFWGENFWVKKRQQITYTEWKSRIGQTPIKQTRIERVLHQHHPLIGKGHPWSKRRPDGFKKARKKAEGDPEVVAKEIDRTCHPDSSQHGALEERPLPAQNLMSVPQAK